MPTKHNNWFKTWLNKKSLIKETNLSDFDRLKRELRAADIVLVEGRSRVSKMIRKITRSRWTHSAIYLGTAAELESSQYAHLVEQHWSGDKNTPLVLEGILGKGTVINALDDYLLASIRICRPTSISDSDIAKVIDYVLASVGTEYDFRQLFDLARYLMPIPILPRRWKSTLFNHNKAFNSKTVCSTLIAEAFAKVQYPILPEEKVDSTGKTRLTPGNPRLYTPSAYDYSPYFSIIKLPLIDLREDNSYKQLPWQKSSSNDNSSSTKS